MVEILGFCLSGTLTTNPPSAVTVSWWRPNGSFHFVHNWQDGHQNSTLREGEKALLRVGKEVSQLNQSATASMVKTEPLAPICAKWASRNLDAGYVRLEGPC